MSNHANAKATCSVTGRELPRRQLINVETIRPALAERIRRDYPVDRSLVSPGPRQSQMNGHCLSSF